jgi:nucleotide-binding universal stress UspA family protein
VSIKSIVFHVDERPGYEDRLAAALLLAHHRGATLRGLYALVRPDIPTYAASMIPEHVLEASWERGVNRAAELQEAFLHAASNAGVEARWTLASVPAAQALTHASRTADLVIVTQPDADDPAAGTIVDAVALDAGRPVLMLPHGAVQLGIGGHVMLAYNESREAGRAMADGMSWLEKASSVDVVGINESAKSDASGSLDEAKAYLALHGIDASAHAIDASSSNAANALLGWVRDHKVTLVIMGAYGHSRLRELVIGGVTASMIAHCPVPVLLCH